MRDHARKLTSRHRYDGKSKTRRKCGFCGATRFRVAAESIQSIEVTYIVCDNADCGAVLGTA
jgi:hypothetical protein